MISDKNPNLYENCFYSGVHFILLELKRKNSYYNYHFISFNKYSISELMPHMLLFRLNRQKSTPTIIIADKTTLPLAKFYFNNINSIFAVLHDSLKIEHIIDLLTYDNYLTPPFRLIDNKINGLTINEVIVLDLMLTGKSAHYIGKHLKCSEKTIHSIKMNILKKMKIKKLNDLIN